MKIDWNSLWQEEWRKRTWQGKTKADWNRRAAGFAKRNASSSYVLEFISRLDLDPEMSVLDMGAGPGTLAIPMAGKVKEVTAVDFSAEMLSLLKERILQEGITNIYPLEGSWEDDWRSLGIGLHDLVIASRSLAVDDLRNALIKLNNIAKQRVVISDRVGSGPFDPALFEAIGRKFVPGPDYIYTVNILYQLGIQARVDFINIRQPGKFDSREAAINSCSWMLGEMDAAEEEMFNRHIDARLSINSDNSWSLQDQTRPKWALIQWEK